MTPRASLDFAQAIGLDRTRAAWRAPTLLLLAAIGILATAGIWVGTLLMLRYEQLAAVAHAQHALNVEASATAAQVEHTLHNLEAALLLAAAADQVGSSTSITAVFTGATMLRRLDPKFWIADAAGTIRRSTDLDLPPGTALVEGALFQRLSGPGAPDIEIALPQPAGEQGATRLQLVRRLLGADGRFFGVAVVSILAGELMRGAELGPPDARTRISLVGDDGAPRADNGAVLPPAHGLLTSTRGVRNLPLSILVQVDEHEAIAGFTAWRHGILWGATGLTALFLTAGAALARAIHAQEAARREAQAVRNVMESVFEAFPAGIQIKDADLRYRWTNPTHALNTGRNIRQFLGKRIDEMGIDPALAATAMAHDRRVLLSGQVEGPVEQAIRRPDGRDYYGLITKVPIRTGGKVTHIVTMGLDITAARTAQAEAEQAKRLLEEVINNVPVSIHVKGEDRRYRWVNRTFAEFYAVDPKAIVGRRSEEIARSQERTGATRDRDLEVLATGRQLGPYETELFASTGKRHHVMVTKLPLRDAGGRVTQILTVAVDITERKRIEEAVQQLNQELELRVADRTAELATSNELLGKVLDNAPIPVVTYDRAGRVASWNAAAERVTGYAKHEVVGVMLPTLTGPARAEFSAMARRIARGESYEGLEARRQHKDGRAIDLLIAGAPLSNAAGEIDGAIGIWLDVTQQRAVEQQLRQAQKMEAVGQVTGGIAHDFNNLLSVVIGNLDMALETTSLAEAHRLLGESLEAAERSGELTRRLLAFARPQILAARRADPAEVVEGMRSMLTSMLGSRVALTIERPEAPWPIEVDVTQLESSLLNLCLNARDAMPDGGMLKISLRNVAAVEGMPSSNDRLRIAVTDTGHGMPPEVAARAFEPFYTTKPLNKGTGLGLSMVYSFVRQSGGDVTIESAPGIGTTVSLQLPCAAALVDGPAPEAAWQPIAARGEKVLVVEDNEALARMVLEQLDHLGYATIAASEADSALRMLRDGIEIDLLFTDIVMPGSIDGRDLAQAALALRPGLPCLLTTGYEQAEAATRPATAHLPVLAKPYRREQLARAVRDALDRAAA